MSSILRGGLRAAVVAASLLLVAGCEKAPDRWATAQKETQGKKDSVATTAVDGSVFNQFFPKPGEGDDIVFKQEKSGFAQASLHQGGKELAMFSRNRS